MTPTDVPDDRAHRAAAPRADLVRRRAGPAASRWPGRCAGTACCRRSSATARASTRRSSRSPPCADEVGERPYDIVIEGEGSQHAPAAWADAGATWWIESMWNAIGQAEPVLASLDRLQEGPP